MSTVLNMALITVFSVLVLSCGTEEEINTPQASGFEDANYVNLANVQDGEFDAHVIPPQEYFDEAFERRFSLQGEPQKEDGEIAFAKSPSQLYLSFNGATIRKGNGAGESFIPCKSRVNFPASGFSTSKQDDIVGMVQKHFDATKANVAVTRNPPRSGHFTTIMVGGSWGTLGCGENRSVLGVAPLDRGNSNPDDIGYAFTKYSSQSRDVANTIAHEAGHSYGLEHVRQKQAVMATNNRGYDERFMRATKLSGGTQDSPKILRAVHGINDGTGGGGGSQPPSDPPPSDPPSNDPPPSSDPPSNDPPPSDPPSNDPPPSDPPSNDPPPPSDPPPSNPPTLAGLWVQTFGGDSCRKVCGRAGMKLGRDSSGAQCASGEARPESAIGRIQFARGCWPDCGSQGKVRTTALGWFCFADGDRKDFDKTDRLMGCYCK